MKLSSTIHPIQSNKADSPQFGLLGKDTKYRVMDVAMRNFHGSGRAAGAFLKMKEGSGGNAHMQFIQDTSILWAPKAIISRSPVELFEITMLEVIESSCFYYVSPFIAGAILSKLIQKAAPAGNRPLMKHLTQPLGKGLSQKALQQIVPAKLGLAVASIAIATSLEYGLNFAKNIMTEKKFHKNDFSSIIGLSDKTMKDSNKESDVMKKAKRRILQSAIVGGGLLIGSLAFARWGGGATSPALQKRMAGLARWLDFDFKTVTNPKTGRVVKQKLDLGGNQLKVLMPFAILSYWDAARDKLERIEAGCRATVTGSYIAYIQPWAAKVFNRAYGSQFKALNIMTGKDGSGVKTLEQIQKDCSEEARKLLKIEGKALTQSNIIKKAAELFEPRLNAKSQLFFIPFLFGILGIGFFTALMNQIWTRYRFEGIKREDLYKQVKEMKLRMEQMQSQLQGARQI